MAEGKISPALSQVFPFEGIPEAHQLMRENRHPAGNMACLVNAVRPGEGAASRSGLASGQPDDVAVGVEVDAVGGGVGAEAGHGADLAGHRQHEPGPDRGPHLA